MSKKRKRVASCRRRSPLRVVAEALCFLCQPLYYCFYASNNKIETTRFQYRGALVPPAFDGFKFAVASDFHCKTFGRALDGGKTPNLTRLYDLIEAERPNAIAVVGDIVDERDLDLDYARSVAERLCAIAPTFYVSGNHERDIKDDELREAIPKTLASAGATLMDDRALELTLRDGKPIVAQPSEGPTNDRIMLVGIEDPARAYPEFRAAVEKSLARVPKRADLLRVALSHRPEMFDLYVASGLDLVFCGHAHGGQIRLPWLAPNGLYAPGQGVFPKFTRGAHREGSTLEIVSRGLGPSVAPTRLFNRPNLVICELKRSE